MRSHKLGLAYQLILIIITTGVSCWVFFGGYYYWELLLIPVLIFQLIHLINFQTKIHEHINYFFESIVNDDFSLLQRKPIKDEILTQLNRNMEKVRQKIRHNILENQQQEYYFRALIEHLNIGVLTFNHKGFIIHANKTLQMFLGVEHLSHLKQIKKCDLKLFDLITSMQSEQMQQVYTLPNSSKQQHLLLKSTPFCSNHEALTIITIQDIDQQLDEKELDSWIKLIRVLTHEIMNGIAPITSLSESILQLHLKDEQSARDNGAKPTIRDTTIKGLNVINEQGERLTRFVESYRKITRLPKPDKNSIDLKPFLEKSMLLSKAGSYSAGVDIALIFPSEKVVLNADEKLLTQVILNILKNSFEALVDIDNPIIRVEIDNTGANSVAIIIENNGPEIPEEIINDVFIPFFTTKESGSGIGLSVSRQIIRLHGGALKVSSSKEKTSFTISLPG